MFDRGSEEGGVGVKHNYLIPLLATLLVGVLAIFISVDFNLDIERFKLLYFLLWVLFFALIISFFFISKKAEFRWIWYILYLVWIFIFFFWNSIHDKSEFNSFHFSHFSGERAFVRVVSEPILKNDRVRFVAEILAIKGADNLQFVEGKHQLNLPINAFFSENRLETNDFLLIPFLFRPINPPFNPLELDYKRYLANRRIEFQYYFSQNTDYFIFRNQEFNLVKIGQKIRRNLVDKYEKFIPNTLSAIIASTLILGYRAELETEILNIFSATGTIHVLSVSGMHVVIVFWLFDKCLYFLRGKSYLIFLKYLILLVSIWAYAMIAGLAPSVIRASCMICFVLISKMINRNSLILNSICSSALLILIYDPLMLFDLGFQLSYCAVLGIIFFQHMGKGFSFPNFKPFKWIWDYSIMSCGAQLGSGPLAMYYFKQFPLYFLFANLLTVLPASAIMYLGFGLVISPIEELSYSLGHLLNYSILIMVEVLEYISKLPMASLKVRAFELWEIIFIYWMLIYFIFKYKILNPYKRHLIGLILISVILYSQIFQIRHRLKSRDIIFFNVGNKMTIGVPNREKIYLIHDFLGDSSLFHQNKYTFHVNPYIQDILYYRSLRFIEENEKINQKQILYEYSNLLLPDFYMKIYRENSIIVKGVVDLLLIRRNEIEGLSVFLKNKKVNLVVVDGSNWTNTVQEVVEICEQLNQRYYILKDNNAYFWKLKERKLWKL